MHADRSSVFTIPADDEAQLAAEFLQLIADATRLKLLWALLQGESNVSGLAELVGAAPAAVSQHLAKLRLAGIVAVRREGNYAYYSAVDMHLRPLIEEALSHVDHRVHGPQADDARHRRVVGHANG